MANKKSKQLAKARAQHRERQRKIKSYGLMLMGTLVIIGAVVGGRAGQTAQAANAIAPEDIVYGQPLHAIHEMTGPSLSSVPFLPKDQPQPKIAVSESFFDFGKVGPTEVVEHQFYIQNLGDAPLTIHRAYTTCGCTTADFTATLIPPGKAIIMNLVFDTGYHDVSGQTVRRGIMIENNDPDLPQLEIWTQAEVLTN